MNWFSKLCRHTGLMIHQAMKPVGAKTRKKEINRTVEEKKISPTVTLRRTTIEEVEFKQDEEKDS